MGFKRVKKPDPVTPVNPDDMGTGPAFAALSEKQKKFVIALFNAPKSHGAQTYAARAAGYTTSSPNATNVLGYQTFWNPKVQAAIEELSRQYLTVLGPHAVRAMKRVLDNDEHSQFGRVLGILMDRISPANSTHTVTVQHDITPTAAQTAETLRRIAELSAKFSVALPKPKVIEGEIVNDAADNA